MRRSLAAVLGVVLIVLTVFSHTGAMGTAAAVPGGLQKVPEDQVTVDLPRGVLKQLPYTEAELENKLEATTYTSKHAATLEVVLTTPGEARANYLDSAIVHGGGPIAIVVSDSTNDDGREVTLDAGLLENILGYKPKDVTGTHEDGSRWSSPTRYEDGLLVFDVPHFSSNAVTFAERVSLTGTPGDGVTYQYDVGELASATDPNVTFTGALSAEWDNITASGVSPDGSVPISVAGNAPPTGPGANGNPLLSVTAPDLDTIMNIVNTLGDGSADNSRKLFGDASGGSTWQSEWTFTAQENRTINQLRIYIASVSSDLTSPSISIVEGENVDSDQTEGTNLGSPILDTSTGWQTVGINSYTLEKGKTYTLQFTYSYNDGDGNSDVFYVGTDTSPSSVKGYVEKRDGSHSNNLNEYAQIELKTNKKPPQGVNVTVGGTTYTLGDFTEGETKSVELDLSTSASDLNFTASRATSNLDVDLDLKERTKTEDPAIAVNGNWLNYTGTLADGETVTLTGNKSWLQDGTNTVEVSLPSVSADAPSPVVGLDYTHDVTTNKSVTVELGKWVERYNFTRTYDASRSSSTLEIPLIQTASELRMLEYRVNGSAWESVPSGSRTFDGTTISVEIDELTPTGGVEAGTTVEIRTAAHRFRANNATVKVVNMTGPNQDLDTRIKIVSWSGSSYLAVGPSDGAGLLHHIYQAEWSEDPYVTIDSSGDQRIYLPKAQAGLKTWVKKLPVEVTPESGDVRVSVKEAGKPLVLNVGPGPSGPGNTVTFRYTATVSGETYILWSRTDQIVRDSAEASSPVLLEGDDSNEILEIFQEESSSSSSGGGVLGPIGAVGGGGLNLWGDLTVPLGIVAVGAAIAILYLVLTRTGTVRTSRVRDALSTRSVVLGGLVALLAFGVATGAVDIPASGGTLLLVGALAIGAYLALRLTGYYSPWVFGGLLVGLLVLGLVTIGDAGVGALFETLQPVLPILAIGGLYLAYRQVKSSGTTNKIVFRK